MLLHRKTLPPKTGGVGAADSVKETYTYGPENIQSIWKSPEQREKEVTWTFICITGPCEQGCQSLEASMDFDMQPQGYVCGGLCLFCQRQGKENLFHKFLKYARLLSNH